jgi:xanthine dehydrogenase small subunit
MRDFLLLYVNGRRHEVRGQRAFGSLSDFLRYDLRLTGTKVVCAEGDCGSCTVLAGRPQGPRLIYRGVTSCIQFLYQLDGAHVITVEGLRSGDGALHPVQDAMVKCHGAQCGFCTPGFVIAMCGLFEADGEAVGGEGPGGVLTETTLRSGLVGNLCRCTGYEAIITAGLAVDPKSVRRANELYPPEKIVADVKQTCGVAVELHGDEGRVAFLPRTLADALQFKADHPDCIPFAGGTDLGVQINKGRRDPIELLVLSHLPELRETSLTDTEVSTGAVATWTALERLTEKAIPEFADMLGRFASPPIRNAGTIGGNIANGSPIADSMPAMYVLGAKIELASVRGERLVNINDFFTGYKRTVMAADELITRVVLPRVAPMDVLRLYKISKRQDLDISTLTAAFLLKRDGNAVASIRIALGGVAATVVRLPKVEAWLAGKPLDEATFAEAGAMATESISPLSDVRGSAAYRSRVTANLFVKFASEFGEKPVSTNGRHL